jgi:signal-transduction protein with cAMP-binding, CBS, and nucleotidyltransferase domain
LFGRIKTEKRGEERIVNIKECLKPIETFARIYALRHGISEPQTLERLKRLRELEVLQEETYREMVYVFDYLWQLRFFNQIATHAELSTDTDGLDIEELTDIEHDNLQSVLSRITVYQTKLSYDFLGVAAL